MSKSPDFRKSFCRFLSKQAALLEPVTPPEYSAEFYSNQRESLTVSSKDVFAEPILDGETYLEQVAGAWSWRERIIPILLSES